MARPKKEPSIIVEVPISSKLASYLDELKVKEGFGESRPAIVKQFTWNEINRLIKDGRLKER